MFFARPNGIKNSKTNKAKKKKKVCDNPVLEKKNIIIIMKTQSSGFNDPYYENDSIFIKQMRNVQRRHVNDLELRFTKQIFHEFDADGSDSIDIDELKLVMEAMGHSMNSSQLRELLEQVDINKSGDLSFSEFVQLIALWKAASQFKLFESDAPTIQDQRIQEALQPDLFLSDSWYRLVWDAVIYLIVVYSFFLITYILVTLNIDDDRISSVLIPNTFEVDIVVSFIWFLDIVLGFFTAQRISASPTDRRVLDTLPEVAKYHFTHLYFYIDLIALLPLHRVTNDEALMWIGFNTALRIFKAPRLFQRSQRMQLSATYVYVHFYLVPMTQAIATALIFVHLLSCFWVLVERIAVSEGAPLFAAQMRNSSVVSKSSSSSSINYVTALYFILSTLTTTGFGDIYLLENAGRIVASCILCVIGTLTTGIVIGNIVSTLSKTNIHTDRENKLVQTLAVLNYFNVPGPLANEILNFQNHLLLHNLGDSHQELIGGLPEEMQKNISLFSRINLVSECVLFSNAHQGTKVALAEAIKPMVYRPDENVVVQGEEGDCMFFVSYGVLGMKLATNDVFFQRGNYFGEIALLSKGAKRTATIKALTYCDLFKLTRDIFRTILARFPKFRVAISDICQQRKKHLLETYLESGDTVNFTKVQSLKFIHEEEDEQRQQQSSIPRPPRNSNSSFNSGAHESISDANENNSESATDSQRKREGSTTSSSMIHTSNNVYSGGADDGERDSPESGVRTDIKSCSSLLTDLHCMVHSMTHGFQYNGPTEIPVFYHPSSTSNNNNNESTSRTNSGRLSGQGQQQPQQQNNNNSRKMSPNAQQTNSPHGHTPVLNE